MGKQTLTIFTLDTPLSKGTLWNNMQDAGEKVRFLRKKAFGEDIRIEVVEKASYHLKKRTYLHIQRAWDGWKG